MEDLFKPHEYADYYIWWFVNCSKGVNLEQLKRDINLLISELREIYRITGMYPVELLILEQIRMYDYDQQCFNCLAVDDWWIEDWQKSWKQKVNECYNTYERQHYQRCWEQCA